MERIWVNQRGYVVDLPMASPNFRYWQCPLHPSMWKYLAFQFKGQLYCFTHLPFGVAPACYVYTTIKQEIFRPLRAAGLRMVFLIDDQCSLEKGQARTQMLAAALCRLLASLGYTLSIEKCQLSPEQLLKFLGLLVDLEARAFRVPQQKLEQLVELARECQLASALSDRLVAKVAGKVMALAPAMHLAPLVARDMWRASQGSGWDKLYPAPTAFSAAVELLVELLARSNGKKWERRLEVVRVVGDASDRGLAAYTPNGELSGHVSVPFTWEQQQAVRLNKWSSTARELQVVGEVVQTFADTRPGFLLGKRLLYGTDNQATMHDLMRMKGSQDTYPIVRETVLLCQSVDVELEVEWRPRTHSEQQVSVESKDRCWIY